MGHKVNPNGMRLGITKYWNSIWYSNSKNFSKYLENDTKVRSFLNEKLSHAFISHIVIERPAKSMKITIHTARPGIVIGKKGEDIEKIRKIITNITKVPVQINISEIQKPELNALLVSENISSQLKRRVTFRRAIKRAVQGAMKLGAKGIKIGVSGRLGGSEIARTEWYKEGQVPLHTLRADIDYNSAEAYTTYGVLGIKVWIYKGEILGKINNNLIKSFISSTITSTKKPLQQKTKKK